MSFFKRLHTILSQTLREYIQFPHKYPKYESERELLMGELCQHLQQVGIKATLLEPDSPEAFRYPRCVLGCVKIEGRNIDVIQVQLLRLVNNPDAIPPHFDGNPI